MRLIWLAAILALPFETFGAEAQPSGRPYRIGWLVSTSDGGPRATFREAMRELGYVEGQNLVFEARSAEGKLEQLPALAADLVGARVDIIVAVAPGAIRAAKQATASVPVVMAFWGGPDLVESGIITSFARPGGDVTGVHMLQSALDPKRLELLPQVVPSANRIGLTHHGPSFEPVITGIRNLAQAVGLQMHISDVPPVDGGYEKAFDSIPRLAPTRCSSPRRRNSSVTGS